MNFRTFVIFFHYCRFLQDILKVIKKKLIKFILLINFRKTMDFQESCSAILLALSFLNRKYLSELKVMKFFVQFSKYLIKFIINISFYYFKSITFMFAIYKTLFFTNVIPSIIQLLLTFHYSFDYIWDVYLLVVIYSSLLFGFPYFLFKFNNERIYKNCINAELNFFYCLVFLFF